MRYYADKLSYDLFDISDKDFNLLARSDRSRDTDDIFGEYTSREIEDWIATDFKISTDMEEVGRLIDFLESLYRNRSFFFRGAKQIQIIDSMDKLFESYVISLDYHKLIIEGDDNDILIRTLINKIKEPIMTKSALIR